MTRVYIIRHAEAEGNLYRRIHGWYDSRVTDKGLLQIAALERRFRDIPVDAAYASDLRRTQLTAQAVVRPRGMKLNIDPDLKEIGMGRYEDKTFGDMAFHDPWDFQLFLSCSPHWDPEGGESFEAVGRRVCAALFRIAQAHPDRTVAIFTHGTAIRCLLSAVRGKHPSQLPELRHSENTGVSCLEIEDGRVHIVFENDASHLPAELTTLSSLDRERRAALPQVWFRSLDMDAEAPFYYQARREAWQKLHGALPFDGPGFLSEAKGQWLMDRRAVQAVMLEGRPIGVLQLATHRDEAAGVGYLPFLCLLPPWQGKGIGVQLIGQAVCLYRAMGRSTLRLRCAPDNESAQRFYRKYGFRRVGSVPGSQGPLDLLEKDIS